MELVTNAQWDRIEIKTPGFTVRIDLSAEEDGITYDTVGFNASSCHGVIGDIRDITAAWHEAQRLSEILAVGIGRKVRPENPAERFDVRELLSARVPSLGANR